MNNFKKYKIEDESFENDNNNSFNNLNIENDFSPNNNLVQMNNPNISNITNQLTSSQLTHTLLQSQTHQQPPQKQTTPYSQAEPIPSTNTNNIIQDQLTDENEPYHHVQIIDEDVENFKRRLDIMIKNFRTDTLKDFMSIKRNLLLEQKSVIESEKQKCDALLSTKGDLIEHLKDDLAKTQKQLSDQIQIKENVVNILFKQNYAKRQKQLKHLAFIKVLKGYHDKKKNKKDKIKKMRDSYHFKLKMKLFMFLKQNAKEMKIFKIVSAKEKECNDKLNEMAQYYGKEISTLQNRLNEANITIEKSKESQNAIQENLKKVLMRGVMAMNMEAMNVLDTNTMGTNAMQMQQEITQQMPQQQVIVNQSFQPNQNKYMNDINVNEIENNKININNNHDQHNAMVNLNPVVKDSNWVNASAVPLSMKQNILVNNPPEDEYEEINIQISDGNNNHNNNQFLYDESNEEGDSVPYKNKIPTPMNHPSDYNYNNRTTNMLYQQQQQQPQISNVSSYYDEMQKSKIYIYNVILF